MRFELMTHLPPEEVIRQAEEFYGEKTRMSVQQRQDTRLELSGAIGVAKISAQREHGHTSVMVETDRGVGFDVTDVSLRFLYSLPHI